MKTNWTVLLCLLETGEVNLVLSYKTGKFVIWCFARQLKFYQLKDFLFKNHSKDLIAAPFLVWTFVTDLTF